MPHAVVLGGSIAGLLAARVLGDVARVTVVEADDPGGADGVRRGVPQGAHVHGLLTPGWALAERWYPGLKGDLAADGAVLGSGSGIQFYLDGVRKVPSPRDEGVGVTRGLLEAHVRRRTLADGRVAVLRGRAVGLVFEGGRVAGVRYRDAAATGVRDEGGGVGVRTLAADLVVDATGRSSRLGSWLVEAGWPAPPVERTRIDLHYATARFRRGDEAPGVMGACATPPAAGSVTRRRFAGLAAVEGDQWLLTVGDHGARPPTDPDGFRRACEELKAPPFQAVARQCEMLGGIETFTLAHTVKRDFAAVERLPGGLVAVGDSVASFNPVYAQGITAAAFHASCLARHLASGADVHASAAPYFKHVAAVTDAAWEVSTLAVVQPDLVGPHRLRSRATRRLVDLLTRAAFTDTWVNERFTDVVHMRAHPSSLKRPRLWWGVARALADQRRGGGRGWAARDAAVVAADTVAEPGVPCVGPSTAAGTGLR
ncbi:NAD(P)/FAD-dependent oxidoreductase [Streptomyces melanogenes]|uniref:NAD(P)/FAD-dependent oxidoreductase n=1 Tax=Streptomyces melanogenes TaxID=67326 RepID=UPI00167D3444|nr:hypothetical protein [Streptomyces melanogenes]GGP91304.1 FAD-binding monooxygenase [Streptomyces melanogenes]